MDAHDYQLAANRTLGLKDRELTHADRLIILCALGLGGEAGEVVDVVKKWLFHGHDYDQVKIIAEMGDVAYYLANLATLLGFTLSDVFEANEAKVRARYPDGFDSQRSIHRDSLAEQVASQPFCTNPICADGGWRDTPEHRAFHANNERFANNGEMGR
jgi:NTP pyrophosphatase (non-canonical NTP hydrolase)